MWKYLQVVWLKKTGGKNPICPFQNKNKYFLSLNAHVQTPTSELGDEIDKSHDALMHFNLEKKVGEGGEIF